MNVAENIYKSFKYGAIYARDPVKEAKIIEHLASRLAPSEYSFSIPATFITSTILLTTVHANIYNSRKIPHIVTVYLSSDRIETISAHLNINAYKKKPEISASITATVDGQYYQWDVSLYGAMYWIKQIHKQLGLADNPTVGRYARDVYALLQNKGDVISGELKNIDADKVRDEVYIAPHSYLSKRDSRKHLWSSAVNYTNIGELCVQVTDGDIHVLRKRIIHKKKDIQEFRDSMQFHMSEVNILRNKERSD